MLGSGERLLAFSERIHRERVPLSGSFDLTYRCNLRCVHCYVGHRVAETPMQAGELTTDQVIGILTEATEAGCLRLLLSGGEPLLRPDFTDIYVAARRLGLIVTVFTNATLIRQEHLDVLRAYPPRTVEVTLYGATPETYEGITGVPGSFARAMRGIDRLQANGTRLGLKTMILRRNLDEIDAMRHMAEERGLRFRTDSMVSPRLDGSVEPLAQRVDPQDAAPLELAKADLAKAVASFDRYQANAGLCASDPSQHLYLCRAGRASFHIDPGGALRPCILIRTIAYDLRRLGFAQAWSLIGAALDAARRRASFECAHCADIAFCGYCPGLFQLETGSADIHSEFVCRQGRERRRLINKTREAGRVLAV